MVPGPIGALWLEEEAEEGRRGVVTDRKERQSRRGGPL